MRVIALFITGLLLTGKIAAQKDLYVELSSAYSLEHSGVLQLVISKYGEMVGEIKFNTHNIPSDPYDPIGGDLMGSNFNIDTGRYEYRVILNTSTIKTIVDTLFVENWVDHISIKLLVTKKDSTSDYIKEIKTLKYNDHIKPLIIEFTEKPRIGSSAIFRVKNTSETPFFGYPYGTNFFASMSEKSSDGKNYVAPLILSNLKCNVEVSTPLQKGQSANGWPPKHVNCLPYTFANSGSYDFELLFSDTMYPEIKMIEDTKLIKQTVFTQTFSISL